MGELATEMDIMDSAKASRGLEPWVEKSNSFKRIDGLLDMGAPIWFPVRWT